MINIIINKTNIKSMLNISNTDYDNIIDMLIPQLLDYTTNYCKNDFILYGAGGYVYDTCDLTITSTTITLTTTLPIIAGDFIRLYGTDYNDDLYQVKTYTEGVITIESTKTLRTESVSAIIAIINFPSEFLSIISTAINNLIIEDNSVKREDIDDTMIEYFEVDQNSFISKNKSILANYKKAFKQEFNEVFCLE